jgi:hypothetical protein
VDRETVYISQVCYHVAGIEWEETTTGETEGGKQEMITEEVIEKPSGIPAEIIKYIDERWSERLKGLRQKFVEAGLAGAKFTEKCPDSPLPVINYHFSTDGVLVFDWDKEEATGDTIVTYVDFETGWRAMVDRSYDTLDAFSRGLFKLEPTPDVGLKMFPLMEDMVEAYTEAVKDAEKKFAVRLPRHYPVPAK